MVSKRLKTRYRWCAEDTGCQPFLASALRVGVIADGRMGKLTFGRRCYWFDDEVREPLENVNVWTPDVVCLTRLGVQCRQFDPVSGPFSMNNERSKLYFYTLACLSFLFRCTVYTYI